MMPNDLPSDAIYSTGIPAPTLIRIILVTFGYGDIMNLIRCILNLRVFTGDWSCENALITLFYNRMTSWLYYLVDRFIK